MLYTSRLTKHSFPANTPYFEQHMILVNSLYELLQPEMTMQQLDKVQLELTHYVNQSQEVYGDRYVNVHLITHLVDCVKRHKPLWCYTAFPFESFNRVILRSIHGTYRVDQGICEAIPLLQHLEDRLNCMTHKGTMKVLHAMSVSSINVVVTLFKDLTNSYLPL